MHQIGDRRRRPTTAGLLVVLASVVLVACGSSSKSSTSSSVRASVPTSTHRTPGTATGRVQTLHECLQKNGITLPKGHGAGSSLSAGGGTHLPPGVTRAQYEAAVKKCGGFARGRFVSPVIKQALARFAACLRTNGVNVPEPNTSGKGPVFNTKGLNARSFKAAQVTCRGDLLSVFRAHPSGSRSPGAPPSAAG